MDKKIIVLAGFKNQFDYFLSDIHREDRDMFVYGDLVSRLTGIDACAVIRIGTFDDRSDSELLYKEALSRIK